MHSSALINLDRFFKIYLKNFNNPKIIDFGGAASLPNKKTTLDILKKYENVNYNYTSIDVTEGSNVDVVLKNPYIFNEIEKESIDIVISTSTLEHVEFFWLSFLEILKILKLMDCYILMFHQMVIFIDMKKIAGDIIPIVQKRW